VIDFSQAPTMRRHTPKRVRMGKRCDWSSPSKNDRQVDELF